MGESKRTQGPKIAAVMERLNNRNQQLYLAVAELAVYRVMAGPMDPVLYKTVMAKLEGVEFTDIEQFFNAVSKAAADRMVELDIAAEQQEKASIAAEEAPAVNPVDQLLAGLHSSDTSSQSAED